MANEGGGVLVQLVQLEAAREAVGAIALEEVVGPPVVENGTALDARRGANRTAGKGAELGHGAAPLIQAAPPPVAAVDTADRCRSAAHTRVVVRAIFRAARTSATAEQLDAADERRSGTQRSMGSPV